MMAINVVAAVVMVLLLIAGTVGFVMWAFQPIPPAKPAEREPQSIDDIVMTRPGRRG